MTTNERLALRMQFDHVGSPTSHQHEDEAYIESTRVWVTNPRKHPAGIEWLRFEADSAVDGPLREMFHIAYRVDDLERAMAGHEVLVQPFEAATGWATAGFVLMQGVPVELLQFHQPDNDEWWF